MQIVMSVWLLPSVFHKVQISENVVGGDVITKEEYGEGHGEVDVHQTQVLTESIRSRAVC